MSDAKRKGLQMFLAVIVGVFCTTCAHTVKEVDLIDLYANNECNSPPTKYKGGLIEMCTQSIKQPQNICCAYSTLFVGKGGRIWHCVPITCRKLCYSSWELTDYSCKPTKEKVKKRKSKSFPKLHEAIKNGAEIHYPRKVQHRSP